MNNVIVLISKIFSVGAAFQGVVEGQEQWPNEKKKRKKHFFISIKCQLLK